MGNDKPFENFMRHARVRRQLNPETGEPMEVVSVEVGLPGREVVRHRRCQNCSHFSTGDLAASHFRYCVARDARILYGEGKTRHEVAQHIARLRKRLVPMLALGTAGRCHLVATGDDFVSAGNICDRWSRMAGYEPEVPVSADPLNEELYDKRGERPPSLPPEDLAAEAAADDAAGGSIVVIDEKQPDPPAPFPSSSSEFVSLGFPAPAAIWTCPEGSTTPVDQVGGLEFVPVDAASEDFEKVAAEDFGLVVPPIIVEPKP